MSCPNDANAAENKKAAHNAAAEKCFLILSMLVLFRLRNLIYELFIVLKCMFVRNKAPNIKRFFGFAFDKNWIFCKLIIDNGQLIIKGC